MKYVSRPRKGAALLEYCVLLGLVSIVAVSVVGRLGDEVGDSFVIAAGEVKEAIAKTADDTQGEMSNDADIYLRPSIYSQACDNGDTSIQVRGDVLPDMNADREYKFAFRRFTQPWTGTLSFNSPGEQEYYGEYLGVDSFGRYGYGQTAIYPPGWNPCIDDQGYPVPSEPPGAE